MSTEHVTSTGHDLSDTAWLDQHFNFSREAYEVMVRWVGFQPGWHVLDAGCGGGSFLPLLAKQVGVTGKLSALDLAPENVAAVEARFGAKPLACPLETRVGNVVALPYCDATFDAIWSANMTQYLTDDELRQMLAEFKRVTKPAGLVAVKEYTSQYWNDMPINTAFCRWIDAMTRNGDVALIGRQRSTQLPKFARAAHLMEARHKYFAAERDGPLNDNDTAFLGSALTYYCETASRIGVTAEDLALWRQVSEPQAAAALLGDPDFHFHIEYIQVVGRVP